MCVPSSQSHSESHQKWMPKAVHWLREVGEEASPADPGDGKCASPGPSAADPEGRLGTSCLFGRCSHKAPTGKPQSETWKDRHPTKDMTLSVTLRVPGGLHFCSLSSLGGGLCGARRASNHIPPAPGRTGRQRCSPWTGCQAGRG